MTIEPANNHAVKRSKDPRDVASRKSSTIGTFSWVPRLPLLSLASNSSTATQHRQHVCTLACTHIHTLFVDELAGSWLDGAKRFECKRICTFGFCLLLLLNSSSTCCCEIVQDLLVVYRNVYTRHKVKRKQAASLRSTSCRCISRIFENLFFRPLPTSTSNTPTRICVITTMRTQPRSQETTTFFLANQNESATFRRVSGSQRPGADAVFLYVLELDGRTQRCANTFPFAASRFLL